MGRGRANGRNPRLTVPQFLLTIRITHISGDPYLLGGKPMLASIAEPVGGKKISGAMAKRLFALHRAQLFISGERKARAPERRCGVGEMRVCSTYPMAKTSPA